MADEAGFCEAFLPTMKKERIGMNRQELMESIRAYQPFNEQEEMDQKLILKCLRQDEDIFTR